MVFQVLGYFKNIPEVYWLWDILQDALRLRFEAHIRPSVSYRQPLSSEDNVVEMGCYAIA
jgi:hypothetical protein